ncbi:Arylsulfatase precursor [Planctomycetes bacterium Pan216]|uniref:Arylsulfatase n=1 Tax=Kolteria novifilia TaxID=2527975 RepID=A0A518B454_9BACT|nr:Arylsulfatase precursor [Planctomycetes bacterium Pan216]
MHTARSRWGLIALGSVLSLATAEGAKAAGPDHPNVILVMTDDQGYGDVASHGNAMIKTPNLDRLRDQSVRLLDYHVCPTCAPTRSSLMTGRYCNRVGVWHTIMGRSLLRRDETTMADLFAENGYRTAMFGKWHLGDNYPFRPRDRGYQETVVHGGGGVGQTPDYWGNDYFDDTYSVSGKQTTQQGYCTDVFFREAIGFIERNRERPFFVYIATNAPHGPYYVDKKYSEPYRAKGVPETMANFYGMITNIDENMGLLMNRLKQWNLDDKTILIFTTDNGTAAGLARGKSKGATWRGYNAGMRGTKGSEYDGGHRVPFFVRYPPELEAGRDVEPLTNVTDVFPTLIDLCHLKEPKRITFDGVSLVPLLTGQAEQWPDRKLVVDSQRIDHPEKWRKSAVMTDLWRLINGKELYNIKEDPGQTNDVAADNPEVVASLRRHYDSWWADVSQRFDEYCPIVLGADKEPSTLLNCHDWHAKQVPWNQTHIRQDMKSNGYWVVEVSKPGTYTFTLYRRPPHVGAPLEATRARLAIGHRTETKNVPMEAKSVSFTLELDPGERHLQTWLTNGRGQEWGAYYVEVRYQGEH